MTRLTLATLALLTCATSAYAQAPLTDLQLHTLLNAQQLAESTRQLDALRAQQEQQYQLQQLRRQQQRQYWQQSFENQLLLNETRRMRQTMEAPIVGAPVAVVPAKPHVIPSRDTMSPADRAAWDQFWKDWEAAEQQSKGKGKACPFWRKACW